MLIEPVEQVPQRVIMLARNYEPADQRPKAESQGGHGVIECWCGSHDEAAAEVAKRGGAPIIVALAGLDRIPLDAGSWRR